MFWNVTSLNGTNASLDLEILSGVVHFSEGQAIRPLNINIKADVVSKPHTEVFIYIIIYQAGYSAYNFNFFLFDGYCVFNTINKSIFQKLK